MATTSKHGLLALYDGVGSLATWTSSVAAQSGFPLSRLQTVALAQATRLAIGSLTSVQVNADFGAGGITANTLFLGGTNLTLSATRRVQASMNSDFSAAVIDTGVTLLPAFDTTLPRLSGSSGSSWAPRWGWPLVYVHPTSVTFRYLRWTITNTGNPDNYLRFAIGRAGLGFQPFYNFAKGWSSADLKGNLRGHRLNFWRLKKTERSQMLSLCRSIESYGRLLVIPEPLSTDTYLEDALWAKLESAVDMAHAGSKQLYSMQMIFREVDE